MGRRRNGGIKTYVYDACLTRLCFDRGVAGVAIGTLRQSSSAFYLTCTILILRKTPWVVGKGRQGRRRVPCSVMMKGVLVVIGLTYILGRSFSSFMFCCGCESRNGREWHVEIWMRTCLFSNRGLPKGGPNRFTGICTYALHQASSLRFSTSLRVRHDSF